MNNHDVVVELDAGPHLFAFLSGKADATTLPITSFEYNTTRKRTIFRVFFRQARLDEHPIELRFFWQDNLAVWIVADLFELMGEFGLLLMCC